MPDGSIALLGKTGGRTVLRLYPASLARPVRVAQPLRDDSLEAALTDGSEQRLAVLEGCDEPHVLALEFELLEQRPSLRVRLHRGRQPLDREHVENEQCQSDAGTAVQHARREAVEIGTAVLAERDELPVELDALGQAAAELGQEVAHVPAAPTACPETGVGADEAAETVELRFEGPAGPARDRVGAREHGFGQPQYHARRAYCLARLASTRQAPAGSLRSAPSSRRAWRGARPDSDGSAWPALASRCGAQHCESLRVTRT